jgi:hypothetical protein
MSFFTCSCQSTCGATRIPTKESCRATDVVHADLLLALDTVCVPSRILQTRPYTKGTNSGVQILTQWIGLDEDMATWEDLDELRGKI